MAIRVKTGQKLDRTGLIKALIDARYDRIDTEITPGNFQSEGRHD